MKKNDLALSIMAGIFFVASAALVSIGVKFAPLLWYRSIYVCNHVMESVSFQKIPPTATMAVIIFGAIYVANVLIRIGATLTSYWILRNHIVRLRKLAPHNIQSIIHRHRLGATKIYILADQKKQAFSLGFINRNVYLSTALLRSVNKDELESILLHEYKHIQNFDSLKLLFAYMIETFLWFIPSLHDITISIRISREIHADTFAIKTQQTPKFLLSSIKKMLATDASIKPHFIPLFAPADLLDVRVRALLHNKKNAKDFTIFSKRRFTISLMSLLAIGYLLITPLHAAEFHIDGNNGVMACTEHSASCITLCEANASHLLKSSKALDINH